MLRWAICPFMCVYMYAVCVLASQVKTQHSFCILKRVWQFLCSFEGKVSSLLPKEMYWCIILCRSWLRGHMWILRNWVLINEECIYGCDKSVTVNLKFPFCLLTRQIDLGRHIHHHHHRSQLWSQLEAFLQYTVLRLTSIGFGESLRSGLHIRTYTDTHTLVGTYSSDTSAFFNTPRKTLVLSLYIPSALSLSFRSCTIK